MRDLASRPLPRVACALAAGMASLALTFAAPGCDQSEPVSLRFDREAASVADHPFPSDLYRVQEVLQGFRPVQLADMPFLAHLPIAGHRGWGPASSVRLPLTEGDGTPDSWVDLDTVGDAVRLYRVGDTTATAVPLADFRRSRETLAVVATPAAALDPGLYAVAVRAGALRTRAGDAVAASAGYAALRAAGDPLTDAAFAKVALFDPDIDSRADTIGFWQFTVADVTRDALLLRNYVRGTLPVVVNKGAGPVEEPVALTPFLPPDTRQLAAFGQLLAQGPELVAQFYASVGLDAVPTDGVGQIVGGQLSTPNFVSDPIPDPSALLVNGTFRGADPTRPFDETNPLALTQSAPYRAVTFLAAYPLSALNPEPEPIPVLVAMHSLSLDKSVFLTLASAVCSAGYALIAIDHYQHGDRQADIDAPEGDFTDKVDPVLAAAGVEFPDPFFNPTFTARTRDKLRQSLVDQLSLIRVLASGDGKNPLVDLDGDSDPDLWGDIAIYGHGLGAMVGTSVAAISQDVRRVVLAGPGGDLGAVLRTSPTVAGGLDLLMLATATSPGFGLLAGRERGLLKDSDEREIYDIVLQTLYAAVDPLTYAKKVVDGSLGNLRPRLLVQLMAGDTVVPAPTSARLARAFASGADSPDAFAHLYAPESQPVLYDIGLATRTFEDVGFPLASGVTQWAGDHGAPIDFADPATTAGLQIETATFLAAP